MTVLSPTLIAAADLIVATTALPSLAATGYLAAGTLLARGRRPMSYTGDTMTRWCIVVPAHNEAQGIGDTIASLRALDYPAWHVTIVVIADNCTDDTAMIARALGALVIERVDGTRRGKGFALEHAFQHLLKTASVAWDAVLVIDADTDVSCNLLRECSGAVQRGAQAVQALYLPREAVVHAPIDARALASRIALTAFHEVRSLARARLGCSAGLRGNGMAFTRDLLGRFPHAAHSVTEDVEYGLMLGQHGVPVTYVGAATVRGDMPHAAPAAATQGQRWLAGRTLLRRRWTAPLLRAVMRRPSRLPLDLLIDLWIPPLSRVVLYVVSAMLLLGIAALAGLALPVAAGAWGISALLLGWHVADATQRARLAARPLAIAAALTRHCLERWQHARLAARAKSLVWHRTPRSHERAC